MVEPLLPPLQQRATMPPTSLRERATLPPLGVERPSGELPSLPTAIVSRPELSALPTAIVAPSLQKIEPPRPAPAPGPSSTVELSAADFAPEDLPPQPTTLLANQNQLGMQAVTEDPSRTLPPGQMRNAMPAVAFPADPTMGQPAPPNQGHSTTAPRPAFDPPEAGRRWPLVVGAAAVAVVSLVVALAWPKAAPPIATLEINLDQPAIIAVDGKPEPLAQKATVQVKPGVPHVVTVLKDGKVVRSLNVPGMAPTEQLQLNVILR